VKLNTAAESHAGSPISAGKVDKDSSWDFTAEDGNKLLGENGDDWVSYAKWHLGEDEGETDRTKARYKYPFGKDGKVYRAALIAIKQRAAQQDATSIADAADRLLNRIDSEQKEGDKKSWFSMRLMRSATEEESEQADPNLTFPVDGAAEVKIYDEIGGWGTSADEFDRTLKSLGDVKHIVMRINSPGGDAFQGIAIDNILQRHPAQITACVDGIAASAVDKIVMPENSFMVVHEPHGMTYGPASAHLTMAEDLERMRNAYGKHLRATHQTAARERARVDGRGPLDAGRGM
jgi:ATP-dependent protease ClpP protease subunit